MTHGAREETVNILIEPPVEGAATFSAISASEEWCDSLVESMGLLSVGLWRLVFSFLVAEAMGKPPLGAIEQKEWPPLGH